LVVSSNKHRRNTTFVVVLSLALISFSVLSLNAAELPFYRGKTIRIILPFSTGGNNDTTARLIARSMSDYIEGNPTILVQNMPGAGGTVATNFACNVAKPDGLTLLSAHASIVLSQLLGMEGNDCNFGRFEYLGSLKGELLVFVDRTDLPYKTADDLKKTTRRITVGGTGPTNLSTLAGIYLQQVATT
jgi:tripartite-type tricarboxylate transporter receptor subunit TctC